MFLTNINRRIKKFVKREDGASAIEYIIIVAMVALVLVSLSPGVKTALTTAFKTITDTIAPAASS